MFKQARNTVAKAVLRYNKKTETYKLVVAFNVTERDARDNLKFPPQNKCNFVSGDLNYSTLEQDLKRTLAYAKTVLRTDTIEFVK